MIIFMSHMKISLSIFFSVHILPTNSSPCPPSSSARRWKVGAVGGTSTTRPELYAGLYENGGNMAMDQYLYIPFLGGYSHP